MVAAAGPPVPRPQRSRCLPSKQAGSVSAYLIGKATMRDTYLGDTLGQRADPAAALHPAILTPRSNSALASDAVTAIRWARWLRPNVAFRKVTSCESLSIVTRARSSILWLCARLSQRCIPSAWSSFSGHAWWQFESEQLRLSRERDEPRIRTRYLAGSDSGPSIRVSRQRSSRHATPPRGR
jgi:hypothetical protein